MKLDASDLIVGRFATVVAKKALLGETVTIVNCRNAFLSGSKKMVLAKYKRIWRMGIPSKGPYLHRHPDRFVKRIIRGMLPYKQEKGDKAFKRITCHTDFPEDIKDEKFETVEQANIKKLPNLKYVQLEDLCKELGAKI